MFIFLIKEIREGKNITQAELSKRTGISRSYIAELESSLKINPSFEAIYKISKCLGVEITKIFVAISDIEDTRSILHKVMEQKGISSKETLRISRLIDKQINLKNKKIMLSKNSI